MKNKPNAVQRVFHALLMLRPVTAFFAPRIHRFDKAVLKLTGGKFAAAEIMGWKIIQLTTTGAKTARPRMIPLIGLFDGEKIALIASSFGRNHNPAWYRNLVVYPECIVEWKGQRGCFTAREAGGAEYDKYWQLGVSYYAGYEKYKTRAGRKIPVMVLEPKQ